MSDTATGTPPRAVDVEEHARIVTAVLREYAEKISALNDELWMALGSPINEGRAAWLLDRSELIRRPLLTVLSRGSGLRENAPLESITRDILSLRMVELEVHLHHMDRQTAELHALIEHDRKPEEVAKLRVAAGLNVMKSGPRRPH